MNRTRARKLITILIIAALVSGSLATIIGAAYSARSDTTVTVLPGVSLTPRDFAAAGMGKVGTVQYATSTFVFFPDSSAAGKGRELAKTAGGASVDLDGQKSTLTVLAGEFTSQTLCDRAFAWYRSKDSSGKFALDTGTSIVGNRSARYSDAGGAVLLVQKQETLVALVYELNKTGSTSASQHPMAALEALARLLAARL